MAGATMVSRQLLVDLVGSRRLYESWVQMPCVTCGAVKYAATDVILYGCIHRPRHWGTNPRSAKWPSPE